MGATVRNILLFWTVILGIVIAIVVGIEKEVSRTAEMHEKLEQEVIGTTKQEDIDKLLREAANAGQLNELPPSVGCAAPPLGSHSNTCSSQSTVTGNDVSPRAQIPKTILDAVDAVLATFPKSQMAFNTPPPIDIDGPSKEIEVRIDPKQSAAAIAKSLTVPGAVHVHEVQISNRMRAVLSGDTDGLKITALSPETQAVGLQSPTRWLWSVKPIKAGQYPVHVELDAQIKVDGVDTPRMVNVFDGSVVVTITNYQRVEHFMKENWQWICTALLIPLGGWWWKKRKDKNAFNVS
jgi:hypothetical protein